MPGVDEKQGTFRDRLFGDARVGRVGIREFDTGVVWTMGARLLPLPDGSGDDGWFLVGIPGVCPPKGYPGIPVVITQSDDAFGDYVVPMISVRAEPPAHAPQRWHPGARQYRTAAAGALPEIVNVDGTDVSGFESYEEMPQAQPTDFSYEIRAIGRTKGGFFEGLPRDQASTLFMHLLKRYSHHNAAAVYVIDTVGDVRAYSCFLEGMNSEVETSQLSDRVVQFSISIRVEGELDISDPKTYQSIRDRQLVGTLL